MKPIRRYKRGLNYTEPDFPRFVYFDHKDSVCHERDTFKVISYNIFHSKRISDAAALIKHHKDLKNPDAVCVQEMTLEAVEKLSKELKCNFVYYPAIKHPKNGKDFGNAVLSCWPIEADAKHILPRKNTKKLQRVAVATTLSVRGKKIVVCSLHMEVILKATFRSEQVASLIDAISTDAQHVIVGGDFNTFTKSYHRSVVEPFLEAGFQLASKDIGWTYKHWYLLNKKTILDHIFVKGMNVSASGKVDTRVPSDHLPIWVELTF